MIKQLIHEWATNRDRFHRLAKEGGWIVIGQIATILGALVSVKMLTNYLKPDQYGEFALGLTIVGLVNQVVMGGAINGIGRFYSIAVEKGDLWGYLRASSRLLSYATLVVVVITISSVGYLLATGQSQWLGLALAIFAFSILSSYNSAINSLQNAARQRAIVAMHRGIDAWLKIGLAVGVIFFLGSDSKAVIIGYTLSALAVTTSQVFFLKQLLNRQEISHSDKVGQDWFQQMWQFSWPFYAWGIFTWLQLVSDRWALESFATTYEVGQYAVLYYLGYAPITIITSMVVTLIFPILNQRAGDATDYIRNTEVHRDTWRVSKLSLAFTVIAFTFAWLLHPLIFLWFVDDAYSAVSHFLPWVVLAGGLFATGEILGLKLIVQRTHQQMLPAKIYTAIIGVVANNVGAWLYGISGVVVALVIFSSVYFLTMFLLARNISTKGLNITDLK